MAHTGTHLGFDRGQDSPRAHPALPAGSLVVTLVVLMAVLATTPLTAVWADAMPVTVRILGESPPRATWRTYGGMTMAARAADLGFKHGGEIGEIRVDWGGRVAAGDVLAALRPESFAAAVNAANADVAVAEAAVSAAQADLDIARRTERRLADLRARGHMSVQQHDEAIATLRARQAQGGLAEAALRRSRALATSARIALDESRIVAPFAGTVQNRLLDEGAQVRPGEAVIRLVSSEAVEARFGLPESALGILTAETPFEVWWQNRPTPATLLALLPEVDPRSRTISAIFRLQDEALPMGAVVELKLPHTLDQAGFWIPLAALIEADRGLWSVYVVNDGNTAERRLVEILHAESAEAYVRGTLAAGDRIVSTGAGRIVPGQPVRIVQDGDNT